MAGQKKRYPAGIPVRQHFFLIPSLGRFQIGNDVLFVLNAHGEAEEAVMELRRVEVLALVVLPQEHDEALVMAQ